MNEAAEIDGLSIPGGASRLEGVNWEVRRSLAGLNLAEKNLTNCYYYSEFPETSSQIHFWEQLGA